MKQLFLALVVGLTAAMGMPTVAAPLDAEHFFAGAGAAEICREQAGEHPRLLSADMGLPSGTVFTFQRAMLPAGRYRLAVPVKLREINSLNTSALVWRLAVSGGAEAERHFDILWIERPNAYQAVPVDFRLDKAGNVTFTLSWQRVSVDTKGTGVRTRVQSSELPKVGETAGDDLDDLLDIQLEAEPELSTRDYLYLAVAPPLLTHLGELAISSLEVDKIRYRPGERATIALKVQNLATEPRQVSLLLELVRELDEVIEVKREEMTLAAGESRDLTATTEPLTEPWGYAVRARLLAGEELLAAAAEYFTVHENMWAIMMAGRGASQFTAHVDLDRAVASARTNQRRYRNWVESGFWAPDEFGDFTPDTEHWWGGQGCYYGSITGTRLMIEEGHKRGLSYAVYSNIWGGDGPPAFEMVRRKPDWGYPSTFNTEWFERWDRNTMGTGKPGPGMHVWPYTIINSDNPEPFRHHGRELIATHRMFGWDAVRYDSHGIDDITARSTEYGREVVRQELAPNEFQYGYNSSVPHGDPSKLAAFQAECRDEGLIMEEGIRGYGENQQSYEAFARRILDYKEEARRHGGHFTAIGMDKYFKNDLLYQYIFWFAGNTHMCYDWEDVSVADYAQFATRHAGLIWDHAVTTVPDAAKWIDYGAAAEMLWLWPEYVHQRQVGEAGRQLILHLINKPAESVLYTHDDCKLPLPLESIPVTVTLPNGAQVKDVWLLTAEYDLSQTRLPAERDGDLLHFTVPRLRFWSTAVIELSNCPPFE